MSSDESVHSLADEPRADSGSSFRRTLSANRERLISVLSPILFLVLWEVTVALGLLPSNFFPAPSTIGWQFLDLVQDGNLVEYTGVTLYRLVGAFLLAAVPGIILGLLVGINPTLKAVVDPLVAILYPIPKIALLPLTIIIFGFGDTSIIVTASMTAFFVILLNTMAGVMEIDEVLLEAGENFHATGYRKFTKVILPGAMPVIFTGLRLGLGLALIVTVAAEFIASENGLGYMIYHSWQILRVPTMYCGFVVVGVIGWLTTSGLERLGSRLMPWREADSRR